MSIRTMAAHPLEATPRSNSYVTIQMRRGLESQMDKSKFLPAEFGATTDTKKLFFAFGAGDVQQLATYQNLEGLMAQALAGLEEEYLGSITQATQNAINATSRANSATTAANQAAEEANEIIDAFKEAVDGTVISDNSVSSSTAYSSQKIESDFLKKNDAELEYAKETEVEANYLKKNGNGSNVTVTFQQAAQRAGIQSGDSLAVAFGKLAKFCADLQDYAFSAPVAALTSTDSTRPLAASMGKQLNDDFTAKFKSLNSALTEDEKFLPPKASQNTFSNLLHIDTSGSYNIDQMKPGCVATEDASELSGSPVTEGAFYAWRELFWIPNASKNGGGKCIVRLTEAYPIAGRIWITSYNTDISEWSQWAEIMPIS